MPHRIMASKKALSSYKLLHHSKDWNAIYFRTERAAKATGKSA